MVLGRIGCEQGNIRGATFEDDLAFPIPDVPGESPFRPWHGKVKTPQYRIQATSPVTGACPLYVVYVGPKITRR